MQLRSHWFLTGSHSSANQQPPISSSSCFRDVKTIFSTAENHEGGAWVILFFLKELSWGERRRREESSTSLFCYLMFSLPSMTSGPNEVHSFVQRWMGNSMEYTRILELADVGWYALTQEAVSIDLSPASPSSSLLLVSQARASRTGWPVLCVSQGGTGLGVVDLNGVDITCEVRGHPGCKALWLEWLWGLNDSSCAQPCLSHGARDQSGHRCCQVISSLLSQLWGVWAPRYWEGEPEHAGLQATCGIVLALC